MSAYRAVALLSLGRALQIAAGFLTIRVGTTLLSPAEFGIVNQLTSLAMLGTAAVLLPVSIYIARASLEWNEAGVLRRNLLWYLRLILFAGLLFGCLAWVLQYTTNLVSGVSAGWVGLLVALYAIGYSAHVMGTSGLNLLGYRTLYVFFGTVALWSGLCFAVSLIHIDLSPEMWVLGIFAGFLPAALSFWFLIGRCKPDRRATSWDGTSLLSFDTWAIVTFVWPQSLVFLLWWIQSQSYRFILNHVADIAQVGLFATAYMICSVPMQTFESIFNELYSPGFFRDLKGQGTGGMALAWNAYASAYIPAVILFGAFLIGSSTFLVHLFLGPRFHGIAPILFIPAITETLRAISSSLHQLGVAKVDMSVNLLPVGVGAVVAPTLVYLFGAHSPLWGTALALLLAGLAAFIVVLPASMRALPVTWPVRRIGIAFLCGLVILIPGKGLSLIFPDPTPVEAVAALVLSVGAMIVAQYAFARKWMQRISVPIEALA